MHKTIFVGLALSLLAGCAVSGAAARDSIPKERVTECVQLCQSVDMELGALVIILNKAGCVCQPAATASAARSSAAAAGGAVVQMIADEQTMEQTRRQAVYNASR